MPPPSVAPSVAYVEDGSDDSSSFTEEAKSRSRRYAKVKDSTGQETPNTSKYRSARKPEIVDSDESSGHADAETAALAEKASRVQARRDALSARRESQLREQEEKEQRARADIKASKQSHTPVKSRSNSQRQIATQSTSLDGERRRSQIMDDPSYYGVQQLGSRPHPRSRPNSFYEGQASSRPPVASMSWHGTHPPSPHHPLPGQLPPGAFPPPPMYPHGIPVPRGVPVPMPLPGHAPTSRPMPILHGPPGAFPSSIPSPGSGHGGSYFDAAMGSYGHPDQIGRHHTRPSSAMAHRPESIHRRPSMSRAKIPSDDRKKMPPPSYIPNRPQSAALPHSAPFRAPAQPPPPARPRSRQATGRTPAQHRRSTGYASKHGFDFDDLVGDDSLFQDISPNPVRQQRRRTMSKPMQRNMVKYDFELFSEDDEDYDERYGLAPARIRSRRQSTHGGVSLTEDKYGDAMRYQNDIGGGGPLPLTAETLKHASRRAGGASTRSTRSSASRDESDFRRSNTTGITRSTSGNGDDVTIKLSGAAVVRVQGAEIACDGGEITFSRFAASRSGSDQASTVYQLEDVRGRGERQQALAFRSRAASHSDANARNYPLVHAPYEPALAADNWI